MKIVEIGLRIIAILFRVIVEIIVAPLKGLRDLAMLLLDELLLPLLGDTRRLIDQLETQGIEHIRDELPKTKEQIPR